MTAEPGSTELRAHGARLGRVCIAALAAAAALVLAAPSLAAVTPHLVVSSIAAGPGQTLTVDASKAKGDDPVARVELYVPSGFELDSPAPGETVGKASATVVIRDLDPATAQAMSGTVTATSSDDPSIAYEGSTCDTSQHLAAWLVQLKGAKGTFRFPVYVDATAGTESSFGPYVLVACFRPADLAAGDPNRSPNGAIVQSFRLELSPFTRPATTGNFRWRSLWTPYALGAGTLNTAGSVEAQSIVVIPTGQIVIFGKKSAVTVNGRPATRVLISGQVLVQSRPVGPVTVTIRHGAAKSKLVSLGGVKSGADGGYTKSVLLRKPAEYFQASANLPAKDLGSNGCVSSFANTPCLDATSGAGRVVSGTMLVRQ